MASTNEKLRAALCEQIAELIMSSSRDLVGFKIIPYSNHTDVEIRWVNEDE